MSDVSETESSADEQYRQELEELEEAEEEIAERREELKRGEVPEPWPHSSKNAFIIAGMGVLAAGGLIAYSSFSGGNSFFLAGAVALLAAGAVANYGRWYQRHFETGQPPTYDSPDGEAAEGVSADD